MPMRIAKQDENPVYNWLDDMKRQNGHACLLFSLNRGSADGTDGKTSQS